MSSVPEEGGAVVGGGGGGAADDSVDAGDAELIMVMISGTTGVIIGISTVIIFVFEFSVLTVFSVSFAADILLAN